LAVISPCAPLQNVVLRLFDFGPLTPKFTTPPPPKKMHKIAYKSASMAGRPEMFGHTRGFSGMTNSMEPCKTLWADPCCHGNEIWARGGDPVAYRLVKCYPSSEHSVIVNTQFINNPHIVVIKCYMGLTETEMEAESGKNISQLKSHCCEPVGHFYDRSRDSRSPVDVIGDLYIVRYSALWDIIGCNGILR